VTALAIQCKCNEQ